MKTSIKLIIKDDFIKKDGTCPLLLQVFLEGKMIRFPLDLHWPPTHFDKKVGTLKPRRKDDPDQNDYTLIINTKRSRLNEIFKHYRLSNRTLTLEGLKDEYYNFRLRDDFCAFWQRELDDRYKRRKIEQSSWESQGYSLAKFKEYAGQVAFHDLTPKYLENYRAWLKRVKKNAAATIEKNMKDLRTYVNLAIADGIRLDNPFKVVKVKHVETVPDVLTLVQVQQLLDLYASPDINPTWHRVLQHFLFSCFTGLRISDIRLVETKHIIDGQLVFTPHKTRNKKVKTVSVPLHDMALQFVNVHVGQLFDTYSEQYCRRVLKQIATSFAWRVNVGTHTARHTFGTNFIELGGDVVTLKEYMGHSKIQTTMQYVHISERRKRERINVFDHFKK